MAYSLPSNQGGRRIHKFESTMILQACIPWCTECIHRHDMFGFRLYLLGVCNDESGYTSYYFLLQLLYYSWWFLNEAGIKYTAAVAVSCGFIHCTTWFGGGASELLYKKKYGLFITILWWKTKATLSQCQVIYCTRGSYMLNVLNYSFRIYSVLSHAYAAHKFQKPSQCMQAFRI